MKNIYFHIPDRYSIDSGLILATVTRTHGSTPQKPGSSALFGKSGLIYGTIGGGIVEAKVQRISVEALTNKRSGHFHFNLANDISNTEEAICGGQISVLVDANLSKNVRIFEQACQSLAKRSAGVMITRLTGFDDKEVQIDRYWISEDVKPSMPEALMMKIEPVVKVLLRENNPNGFTEIELKESADEPASLVFLEPVFPASHLVIAGAGHIGKAMTHLGSMLGFEVTVIDDRPELANKNNLPEASHIIVNDVGKAMRDIKKDRDTYIIIVTHGHKDDAEALKSCIGEGLAYTGMIGSKKKISAMRLNFIENGWATPEQWDSVYTPIGLEIKSQTIEEIAVSIAAQLVLVKNSMLKSNPSPTPSI
jgi:xanthine dehydrogenase accessory factor